MKSVAYTFSLIYFQFDIFKGNTKSNKKIVGTFL